MRESGSSSTARLIALSTYFMSREDVARGLIPEASAMMCRRFVERMPFPWKTFGRCVGSRVFSLLGRRIEHGLVPGIQLHFILRKRLLEDTARSFLATDHRQVVVLGGGFDTLALRLHGDYPLANFIEIDHPATQDAKLRSFSGYMVPGSNLHFLPIDFSLETLADRLHEFPAFQSHLPTLFIMEGVLMYLSEQAMESTFDFIRGHLGNGGLFAFTFMEKSPAGLIRFKNCTPLLRLFLWIVGEPFRWGLPSEGLASFLEARGMKLRDISSADSMGRRYLHPGPSHTLAAGEYLAVAVQDGKG